MSIFIITFRLAAILLIAAASIYPIQLIAQSENIIFRNITPDDGLPVTTVTDVTQDSFGYIWIGSWDGVYRYDGNTFEKKSDQGRYLAADDKSGVWISYNRGGPVAYYSSRTDSLMFFDVKSWEGRFPRITIDAAGTVWSESDNGLYYFDESTSAFEKDSISNSDFSYGEFIAHQNGSLSFFYWDSSQIWGIGNRAKDGEIQYEDFPTDQNNPDPTLLFNALSIPNMERYLDNGILLINEFGWAYKEDFNSDWTFVKPDRPNILLNIGNVITHNNDLYVQHVNALTKFNIKTGMSTTYHHNPLDSKSILPAEQLNAGTRLFIDRQEVLWVPSFSYGFSRLNLYESDFGLLRSDDGTPIRDVISAVELEDGSFWIGTRITVNGLLHFDADGNLIQRYSGPFDSPPGKSESNDLSHPFVWSLAVGSDGSIWAGTGSPGPDDGGLNRIRPDSDQITRFKHDPNNEASLYPGNWVVNIYEDGNGRIWVQDFNQLAWIDPNTETVTRFNHPENSGISDDEGINVLKTKSGDLIISSQNNTYYRIHHQDLSTEMIALNVEREWFTGIVAQDMNNRFWARNVNGFGLLDSTLTTIEKWYDVDVYDIPVSEISSFQFDRHYNAWLGTDNGIVKFDTNTEEVTHYSYERGLQGYSYERELNYKGPSGKIYLGDNGGINIFDPDQIQSNPHPPEMVFTNLSLNGETIHFGPEQPIVSPIQLADEVVVQPDISTISFEFAALHFAGDQSNQYQYMLEGFDSDWRSGGSVGQATYTNLSPGDYTFKIRGSNLDGVWSEGSTSIAVAVLPPWYRTWWAYGFYLILLIAGIISVDRVQRRRVQQQEREKAREKELEQAKEIEKAYKNLETAHKELEQAHSNLKSAQEQLVQQEKLASLGQLTAGIAHEIKNPLNFVNNFSELSVELIEEAREELSAVSRQLSSDDNGKVDEALEILNDIEANLRKIHEHGTRADSIVKSMLQHSRGGDGKMEPTPLNPLIKEYVNLAFHGMRAGKEPINVDIDLQLDESIGNVPLVAEDFSRVILNLCNNAFDACAERSRSVMREQLSADSSEPSAYQPKLTVRTFQKDKTVTIEIEDNGPGIPDEIKGKILQPFFTTKKGTQGTGLGLSITNDIVKAHGGKIEINSSKNSTIIAVKLINLH